MKVYYEFDALNHEAWAGAKDTWKDILHKTNYNYAAIEEAMEEIFPEGVDQTTLNDFLWFEPEILYEILGIQTPDEEEQENEDEQDDKDTYIV